MKKLILFLLVVSQFAIADQMMTKNRTPEQQKAVNPTIFDLLAKNGSVEGVPYNFDQIFSSASRESLVALQKELLPLGYRAESIDQHSKDGVTTYCIDAYKKMEYSRDVLERDSLTMLKLAEKYRVFYDGWGAEVK